MFYQVAREYSGMDARQMDVEEIRFWYDGLRWELKEHTKPKPGGNSG